MKKLEGKVAVVTGGNSGIGLATAKLFAEEGAQVAISGRDQNTLDAAIKTIGNGVLAVKADVSRLSDIDQFYKAVQAKFGRIDVIFANAGIGRFAPIDQTNEALFDEQFDINVKGAYFTVQKALPLLNDKASIIFNTSIVSSRGFADSSVYSANKAAVRSFARTLAADLLSRGIRVNAVAPGPIQTAIFERSGLPKEAVDEFTKMIVNENPMKRFGSTEEVAKAVLFLASDDSSYTTGEELHVDGGRASL